MKTSITTWRRVALAAALVLAGTAAQAHDGRGREGANALPAPLVIGHRGGGSGYLPEHTLEAYALGIELGADFVEPDLVATKDGHLIARHEPNLKDTTNVSALPQFAARRRTVMLDGIPTDGWWASDFTLAEIRQLRAVQPVGARSQAFNGRFQIPTLEEVIALAKNKAREQGRTIGIYPETKHPTYHQQIGLALEDRLLAALTRAGWNHREAPVFIQSFETANLRYLRSKTRVRLVQLVDADDLAADGTITFAAPFDKPYDWVVSGRAGLFKDLLTPAGLAEVASYADGIGPWKYYIQSTACKALNAAGGCADVNGDGAVNEADRVAVPATDLVQRAHSLGLVVHTWTFRNERNRQPLDDGIQPSNEYTRFFDLGVDGVFSDFADTAYAARVQWQLKTDPAYARCLVQGRGCAKRD
ncbi:Glycerophosphoryl diester phosphodiesterase [Rubrivivax sp. A210]|uniref:glycerophosphodiester phosphodiesterase n=1 Tax=Rubrivivax sp. A210 TaxID=2772301 RepID=UPI0019181420|nr:glycerophosphodiester phosphodiesterase [Rubrivivax sp. A210]CAD5371899.1 Glycerophosphoryl diester phosphodiesterase [Rubrivivax sp. A210]